MTLEFSDLDLILDFRHKQLKRYFHTTYMDVALLLQSTMMHRYNYNLVVVLESCSAQEEEDKHRVEIEM